MMQYSFIFSSSDSNLVNVMGKFNREPETKSKYFKVPLDRDFSTFTFNGCSGSSIDIVLEDERFLWFAKKFIKNLLAVKPDIVSVMYLNSNKDTSFMRKRNGEYFVFWDNTGAFK